MKIYTVLLYRWGSEEGHIYLLGTWQQLDQAENNARDEVISRDGKYDAVVFECELDVAKSRKAICTYRGLGFYDRIDGYHVYHSSVWSRMLEALKGKCE